MGQIGPEPGLNVKSNIKQQEIKDLQAESYKFF